MSNEQGLDTEQQKMMQAAEELERKIVTFTNIDKESFTHSFRGISTTVKAGASVAMRLPEADHLALHLSRKILSREKKAKTKPGKGVQLYTDKEISDMKAQIITQVAVEDSPESLSPEEAHRRDQERLQKEFGPKEPKITPPPAVSKKDLIADLESRGVKVDPKLSNDELQAKILECEEKGIVAKDEEAEE